MRRILIYDVAADFGGAVTVLNKYYERYKNRKDTLTFMVIGVLEYAETDSLKVIRLPWVKKTWGHRLLCDNIYMPFLIRKLKIDEVISLQNVALPLCPCPQTVYVHNALPFAARRYRFSEDKYLWIYQNIIGGILKRSLKKADKIIVQAEWMKKTIVSQCHLSPDLFEVEPMKASLVTNRKYQGSYPTKFFFPGTPHRYKNHQVILEAAKILKEEGVHDFEILFTFTEDEGQMSYDLVKKIREWELPVHLLGHLDRETLEDYYAKSVLVFPSMVETVGLPLKEAGEIQAPIIAADCPYARDAVGEYTNVVWFHPEDPVELAGLMKQRIKVPEEIL